MEFHERLKELRVKTGLSQKDFASLLGIENSKFNKWENGKSQPDYETVRMLADHFGVSTDYLLGNTDIRNPENKALTSELGLSETAIEVLKSLGRIRVKEFSEHDQRTLLNVLDNMLQCKFADIEGLLKNVGMATSRQNFIREMKQNLAAEQDPEKHEKYNITMLLLNAGTMEADTKLHCIIDTMFKKEAEEFYGPDD
jgi:transcriptional regulator with XRE-family HTH domain